MKEMPAAATSYRKTPELTEELRMAERAEYNGQLSGSRGSIEKLKIHTLISAIVIAIGVVLMIGKIYADSEPGGIPILLVLLGLGWHFITRLRIRSHYRKGKADT